MDIMCQYYQVRVNTRCTARNKRYKSVKLEVFAVITMYDYTSNGATVCYTIDLTSYHQCVYKATLFSDKYKKAEVNNIPIKLIN